MWKKGRKKERMILDCRRSNVQTTATCPAPDLRVSGQFGSGDRQDRCRRWSLAWAGRREGRLLDVPRGGLKMVGETVGHCQAPRWGRGVPTGEVPAGGVRLKSVDVSTDWRVPVSTCRFAEWECPSPRKRAKHGDRPE